MGNWEQGFFYPHLDQSSEGGIACSFLAASMEVIKLCAKSSASLLCGLIDPATPLIIDSRTYLTTDGDVALTPV